MVGSVLGDLITDAVSLSNGLLGVPSDIVSKYRATTTTDVLVIINKNKKVTDEFKQIVGFRNEANFLKSDYPHKPDAGDIINCDNGETWRITGITLDTNSKWYVEVTEVY